MMWTALPVASWWSCSAIIASPLIPTASMDLMMSPWPAVSSSYKKRDLTHTPKNLFLFPQIQPGFGAIHMMDRFVYRMHFTPVRVWWRCTVMDSGELCVMTHLIAGMLTLYADNWDILELWPMITCHSKHVYKDYLVKEPCFYCPWVQNFLSLITVVAQTVSLSGLMMCTVPLLTTV